MLVKQKLSGNLRGFFLCFWVRVLCGGEVSCGLRGVWAVEEEEFTSFSTGVGSFLRNF